MYHGLDLERIFEEVGHANPHSLCVDFQSHYLCTSKMRVTGSVRQNGLERAFKNTVREIILVTSH